MVKLTIEDIMILIMIMAIVGIGLWMLVGSPTEMQAIISTAMFFGTAGLFVLKKIFSVENNSNIRLSKLDKNTSISFLNVKHQISKIKSDMNNRFNNIDNKLDVIQDKISK